MSDRSYAIDFHVHSRYSFDSWMPTKMVIETARRRGLNGIAVVDHDTVRGGLAAMEANRDPDFLVIPGIEVKSDLGDIIGLFVSEEIKSRTFGGVIEEIHAQGGLAYVPHPIRTFGPRTRAIHSRYSDIDVWEKYNGRYDSQEFSEAKNLFPALGIDASLCGSDAHHVWEIGALRTLLPELPRDAATLLRLSTNAVLQAQPRPDFMLRTGIALGALVKAYKRRQYAKVGQMVGTLPLKAVRRSVLAYRDRHL